MPPLPELPDEVVVPELVLVVELELVVELDADAEIAPPVPELDEPLVVPAACPSGALPQPRRAAPASKHGTAVRRRQDIATDLLGWLRS
jgi:hypothetical protein